LNSDPVYLLQLDPNSFAHNDVHFDCLLADDENNQLLVEHAVTHQIHKVTFRYRDIIKRLLVIRAVYLGNNQLLDIN